MWPLQGVDVARAGHRCDWAGSGAGPQSERVWLEHGVGLGRARGAPRDRARARPDWDARAGWPKGKAWVRQG